MSATTTSTTEEIEGKDVVRLVFQFLKESGLTASAMALERESRIAALEAIESEERLSSDVKAGHWDSVFEQLGGLRGTLAEDVQRDLYEQAAVDLVGIGEKEAARTLIRNARPLSDVRQRLERFAETGRGPKEYFAALGTTRESRREQLARSLVVSAGKANAARPSRLLELLGEAVRWEKAHLKLPPGARVDLLRGGRKKEDSEDDGGEAGGLPTRPTSVIRLGKGSHFEVARFSADGERLVTGSADGFAEVWDQGSGLIDERLKYQAEEDFMMHDDASVLSVAFSADSETLATGGDNGSVKVWDVATGKCLRRMDRAHERGVTCATFSADSLTLFTGSFDSTARAHGLRSGSTLRVFRGHGSFVNDLSLVRSGACLATASSDGTVRIWDAHSADCLAAIEPTPMLGPEVSSKLAAGIPVHTVQPLSHEPDTLLVGLRHGVALFVDVNGRLAKSFSLPQQQPKSTVAASATIAIPAATKKAAGRTGVEQVAAAADEASAASSSDFVCCAASPSGKWLLCGTEDGSVHCFEVATGTKKHSFRAHERGLIGIIHHPRKNLLVTWSEDGTLKIWAP